MGNKIKLLLLKYSMPTGGAESLILQHIENLNRDKFEVHFISLSSKGRLQSIVKDKADYYMCLKRKFFFDLLLIIKLRQYIIKKSIKLVHSHDWISLLYLLLATNGLNVSIVSTIHSQAQGWRSFLTLFLLKKSDLLICVSKNQKLALFEQGVSWEKMVVVYNCFDNKKFKLSNMNVRNKNKNIFKLIMVGNYYWQKDHETLIKAINIVKIQGHKIELHLVGGQNKELLEYNQKLVRELNLHSIVHFHQNKRIEGNFLEKFDLFIFSTKSERMPIAPLEAMGCALPVLVSDIPPNMELIRFGKDGLFFETGSSESCANEIIRFINNPKYRESMSKVAFLRSKEFYADKIVRKLENEYRKALYQ